MNLDLWSVHRGDQFLCISTQMYLNHAEIVDVDALSLDAFHIKPGKYVLPVQPIVGLT